MFEKIVLLLGEKSANSRKLESILGRYFSKVVRRKSNLEKIMKCRLNRDDIHLIIATDPSGGHPDMDFFQVLKSLFPHARIICLFDHIGREREISLRSLGIVFLGTFKHFIECSEDILKSAVQEDPRWMQF